MKILVAVDSFKGTLSSIQLNQIIESHFHPLGHEIISMPISDGGEGFIDALNHLFKTDMFYFMGKDPIMNDIHVPYLLIDNTAYLELHATSGITLIPKHLHNPLNTTTYGLGLLIKEVISKGAKRIVIGLGGSATNDGGAGMLQALGAKFYDKDHLLTTPMNGKLIGVVERVDLSEVYSLIESIQFEIASDVTNPLCGEHGASHVFAKQKGASPSQILRLELHMQNYASIIESSLNESYQNLPGAGAAGGVGFACLSMLHAKQHSGIDYIMNLMDIEEKIKSSDLIIVGEGKLDYQTRFGKAPYGVASLAKKYNKKVIGLFGQATSKKSHPYLDEIYAVVPKYASLKESLNNPSEAFLKMLNDVKIP